MSTMEFPQQAIPSVGSAHGSVHKITVEETEAALKKMRLCKATGPDDLAADVWKSKLWCAAEWLAEFLNKLELAASIEPFALVLILQELDLVEPVVLASEFLSHYLMHWRETDIDMACDFSHGDSRISVIFQILTVFSMQPWTINVMAKLPESMNYCGCR
ncbi:unnamed protein product [Heligmosomoides polygyrus]|uniref:Nuclear pore complex protein n=1 Tax=Heligmosomoides polygyrus TaxID=6339 RepID=A0A183G287_HELPZ|nr:unnamed protein product [Heligmosomoides polygyrus]